MASTLLDTFDDNKSTQDGKNRMSCPLVIDILIDIILQGSPMTTNSE